MLNSENITIVRVKYLKRMFSIDNLLIDMKNEIPSSINGVWLAAATAAAASFALVANIGDIKS